MPLEEVSLKKGSIVLVKQQKPDGRFDFFRAMIIGIENTMILIDKEYNTDKVSHHSMVSHSSVVGVESNQIIASQPQIITDAIRKLRERFR